MKEGRKVQERKIGEFIGKKKKKNEEKK